MNAKEVKTVAFVKVTPGLCEPSEHTGPRGSPIHQRFPPQPLRAAREGFARCDHDIRHSQSMALITVARQRISRYFFQCFEDPLEIHEQCPLP